MPTKPEDDPRIVEASRALNLPPQRVLMLAPRPDRSLVNSEAAYSEALIEANLLVAQEQARRNAQGTLTEDNAGWPAPPTVLDRPGRAVSIPSPSRLAARVTNGAQLLGQSLFDGSLVIMRWFGRAGDRGTPVGLVDREHGMQFLRSLVEATPAVATALGLRSTHEVSRVIREAAAQAVLLRFMQLQLADLDSKGGKGRQHQPGYVPDGDDDVAITAALARASDELLFVIGQNAELAQPAAMDGPGR